jgi:hypothetical protein
MKEYRPGDSVEVEMKVKHLQVLRNVTITYRNVDAPAREPFVLQLTWSDKEPDTYS